MGSKRERGPFLLHAPKVVSFQGRQRLLFSNVSKLTSLSVLRYQLCMYSIFFSQTWYKYLPSNAVQWNSCTIVSTAPSLFIPPLSGSRIPAPRASSAAQYTTLTQSLKARNMYSKQSTPPIQVSDGHSPSSEVRTPLQQRHIFKCMLFILPPSYNVYDSYSRRLLF